MNHLLRHLFRPIKLLSPTYLFTYFGEWLECRWIEKSTLDMFHMRIITYNSLNERDQYIQFLETLQFLCNFRSEQISWNIHFDEVQTLPSITKSLFEYRSPNTSCGMGSYRLRMDAKCIKLLSSAAVNVENRASAGKFSEVSILGNKPSMR